MNIYFINTDTIQQKQFFLKKQNCVDWTQRLKKALTTALKDT